MSKITFPSPQQQLEASLVPNVMDSKSALGIIAWDVLADRMCHDSVLAQQIANIRQYKALMEAETDEQEQKHKRKIYDYMKRSCGAFIPAAQFSGGRKREDITALTGVSMVDFDHVPADRMQPTLDAVRHDPHTMMAYITTSGEGNRHAILMSRAGILNMMGFGEQEIADIVRPHCPRQCPTRRLLLRRLAASIDDGLEPLYTMRVIAYRGASKTRGASNTSNTSYSRGASNFRRASPSRFAG